MWSRSRRLGLGDMGLESGLGLGLEGLMHISGGPKLPLCWPSAQSGIIVGVIVITVICLRLLAKAAVY